MSGGIRWLLVAACLVTPVRAADPPEVLLARFQEKIRQDLTQIVNYTCLETIHRVRRLPNARAFEPLDTVRLEVSRVGGKELFAWPGAHQFSDANVKSFADGGTTSTGAFETTAREVFASGAARFQYHGETRLNGRAAVQYDFELPASHGFQITVEEVSRQVDMTGSFWFDPASLDLIGIRANAAALPAVLQLSNASLAIFYARVLVGGARALLPQHAEMEMTGINTGADRNEMEFSKCRAYQTESTISFDAPAVSSEAPKLPREVRLPAGLLVPVVLETAIDFSTSAVGDPVRAKVRADVRRNGELVFPAGAAIGGRIRLLERRFAYHAAYVVAGIELLDVEWPGQHADFYGELVDTDARKGLTAGFAVRGRATYILRGSRWRIDPGLGLLWRVLERPADQAP